MILAKGGLCLKINKAPRGKDTWQMKVFAATHL